MSNCNCKNWESSKHTTFDQKLSKLWSNDCNKQKLLETRVDRLNETVEKIQNTVDKFMVTYETDKLQNELQQQESQDDSEMNDDKDKLEDQIGQLKVQLARQSLIHSQEKQKWEEERSQLQLELQNYKATLQTVRENLNCNPDFQENSSDDKDASIAQYSPDGYESHDRNYIVRQQGAKILFELGPVLTEKYMQQQELDQIDQEKAANTTEKKARVENASTSVPESSQLIEEKTESPADQIGISFKDQFQAVLNTSQVNDEKRQQLNNEFLSVLEKHDCSEDSQCSIVTFRNHLSHSYKCTFGKECQSFICKQKYLKLEHLKFCKDKLSCYIYINYKKFNEKGLREMIELLEQVCPMKQKCEKPVSESYLDMVAHSCEQYGLIGYIDENQINTQIPQVIQNMFHYTKLESDDEGIQRPPSHISSVGSWDLLEAEIAAEVMSMED